MKVEFNAKMWRSGGSWVLTVPTQYVNDGHINPERQHRITLEEQKEVSE